jgi:histidinol-phosphate phosphatase family protein
VERILVNGFKPTLSAMDAAIVAGGLGTRAASMTAGRIPKALVPIGGVPIIFRQLRMLQREGVTRINVLAGHLGEVLRPALAPESAALDLKLEIVVEPQPRGTAGCLGAIDPGAEETLVIYGDMLFDIALSPLRDFHRAQKALLTVVAHPNDHPRTSDLIVEHDGLLKAVIPRDMPRDNDHRNLVPAGLYLASPAFFTRLHPGTRADMVLDVLPSLLTAGDRIAVYNTLEYLRDVGTPARHRLAEEDLRAGRVEALNRTHRRPAILFDCDGVLNEEPGGQGAVSPEDIKLIPEAAEAVRRARAAGFLTIAITNRPQVAKGLVTCAGLAHILGRLEALLAADGGVLDRIYYCPHHPEAGFPGEVARLKVQCQCRKPGSLLIRQAFADLPIDPIRSVVIGDSLRDIGAARGARVWAYGVRTGYGCRDVERYRRENGEPPRPDMMFGTVSEAVDFATGYLSFASPALTAVRAKLAEKTTPFLVGVCGRSRAGKSALAHAIVRALTEEGTPSLHVRLDDWIIPVAERPAGASAEARSRIDALPGVVATLRAGKPVTAPGYDAATRGGGQPVTYDPRGKRVVVLEGSFGCHASIRAALDLALYAEVRPDVQHARFCAFYHWKQLEEKTIEALWRARLEDEWPAVDLQRDRADLVFISTASVA